MQMMRAAITLIAIVFFVPILRNDRKSMRNAGIIGMIPILNEFLKSTASPVSSGADSSERKLRAE